MSENKVGINAFILYAPKDEPLKNALDVQLKILIRQGFIDNVTSGKIDPHKKALPRPQEKEMAKADLVLMLLSPAFVSAGYLEEPQVKTLPNAYLGDEKNVIFVLLSDVDWTKEDTLYDRIPIINDGKAVTNRTYWHSIDEAFAAILKELKETANSRRSKKKAGEMKPVSLTQMEKTLPEGFQLPGGPLNPGAGNYIERPMDAYIDLIFNSSNTPMLLINGSPLCGKTSLLLRVKHEAEKKNIKTLYINFRDHFGTSDSPSTEEVFKYIIHVLKKRNGNRFTRPKGIHGPTVTSEMFYEDLATQLLEQFLDGKRCILLTDSLDLLLNDHRAFDAIIRWLMNLRHKAGFGAFENLTVFVAMAILTYTAAQFSPLRTHASNVSVPSFGATEIRILLEKYEIHTNLEQNAADILDFFGGQPFLSHLAVFYMAGRNETCFEPIKDIAMNMMNGFNDYWFRIKEILNRILKVKKYSGGIISVLEALSSTDRSRIHIRLIDNLFEELSLLGLVGMDRTIASPFIENAVKSEIEKNESI